MACTQLETAPRLRHFDLLSFKSATVYAEIRNRPTLGTGHNSPAVQRNIDTRDQFIMTLQLVLELESTSCSSVKLDSGVSGNGESLLVSGEGMIRDWMVKEVMDFWRVHFEDLCMIGGALYYQCFEGKCRVGVTTVKSKRGVSEVGFGA